MWATSRCCREHGVVVVPAYLRWSRPNEVLTAALSLRFPVAKGEIVPETLAGISRREATTFGRLSHQPERATIRLLMWGLFGALSLPPKASHSLLRLRTAASLLSCNRRMVRCLPGIFHAPLVRAPETVRRQGGNIGFSAFSARILSAVGAALFGPADTDTGPSFPEHPTELGSSRDMLSRRRRPATETERSRLPSSDPSWVVSRWPGGAQRLSGCRRLRNDRCLLMHF